MTLFIKMQSLLISSSLDKRVTESPVRYDHNIDQAVLPARDDNDRRVMALGHELIRQIDSRFPYQQMMEKFPIKYMVPINNIVHKELSCYRVLLSVVRDSVEDLVNNIDGQYPIPQEVEDLWNNIQTNKVPDRWLKFSFVTAKTSLADFLVELGLKLEFWNELVAKPYILDTANFWLPAFFSPKSFLHCLAETRSRTEQIPVDMLMHQYEVQPFMAASKPCEDKHALYINGFWLEGADWDEDLQLLVETTQSARFLQFPCIKLSTPYSHDIPKATMPRAQTPLDVGVKSPLKLVRKLSLKRMGAGAEADDIKVFACPVFKSTLRLSNLGLMPADSEPLERIQLCTRVKLSTWVKRSVALVLEVGDM